MNAALLSQHISGNENMVFTILETLGFQNITYNPYKKQFRFARDFGTNPTSTILDCSSLRYYCFSTGNKGNVFTLIMDRIKCTFPESLKFCVDVLDLDSSAFSVKVKYPFKGFYKSLIPDQDEDFDLPTIPEETLAPYLGKYNTMFFHDGIDYLTQELYQIGYDEDSHRITIPERTFNGELCGIMGRLNDPNCSHAERWYPIIECSRNKTLFGLVQNYKRIVEARTVVLFESEKAPMQCNSFGCKVALGLCGCHVSPAQKAMLLSMKPSKIILALDEGLEEEKVRYEANKLVQDNIISKVKVGYVWDANHEILPEGSKKNPADMGRDAYKYLLTKNVRWM